MIIGVAGHQLLQDYDINWIKSSIEEAIDLYHITKGYSSLAVGSDQLFIEILLQHNMPYDIIIPCKNYELTFKNKFLLSKYKLLLSEACAALELNFDNPGEEAFYAAGKKIVDLSEILIAIWNGEPAKGLGGTADVVSYAQSLGKIIWHINPNDKTKRALK